MITVKELLKYCTSQVAKGNGDKKILVADDPEGNGYHGLFYEFTEDITPYAGDIHDNSEDDLTKLIILG